MPAAFPGDSDVTAFLNGIGVGGTALASITAGAAAGAATRFQELAGWLPFIKDANDVTRTFDPPGGVTHAASNPYFGGGRRLELDCGLLACTSVAMGATVDNPTGTVLTLGRNYQLMPQNAPARSKPYTYIQFSFPVWGGPGSIVVVGKWGFSASVPQDAWNAVLWGACADLAPVISQNISMGLASWREDDVSETYDEKQFESLAAMWRKHETEAILRYRFPRFMV